MEPIWTDLAMASSMCLLTPDESASPGFHGDASWGKGVPSIGHSGSQSTFFCFFPRLTSDFNIMALAQEYHVEHESPVSRPTPHVGRCRALPVLAFISP